MELNKRKSLILHFDSLDVLDELGPDQISELFIAIRDYNMGKDIQLTGLMKAIFIPFKNQFDRDIEKYIKKCEVNAKNGKTGGRPKKTQENPNGFSGIKNNPEKAYNKNDNKSNSKNDNKKESKNKLGEYKNVLLSVSEKNKLIEEYGEEQFNTYLKILDEGIEMKGYKYKNHNLAIRNWMKRDGAKKIDIKQEDSLTAYEKQKKEKLIRYYGEDWEKHW